MALQLCWIPPSPSGLTSRAPTNRTPWIGSRLPAALRFTARGYASSPRLGPIRLPGTMCADPPATTAAAAAATPAKATATAAPVLPEALLSPIQVGPHVWSNRIAMAPLTRGRSGASGLATKVMAEYYAQRASAGLIISEGTATSDLALGWWGAPRIHRPEDVPAWTRVTNAVHAKGGRIFCQLWHCGRASHSVFRPGAEDPRPVAASAIKLEGHDPAFTPAGRVPSEVPRALTTEQVAALSEEYRHAASVAKEAGFDGVEVHCANGYLLDGFLQSRTNKRADKYGGSLENRFRLIKEVLQAVLTVFPSHAIGIRLSPNGVFNDMGSDDFRESFLYYAEQVASFNLAYLHVIDGLDFGFHKLGEPLRLDEIRKVYPGIVMGNCGYDRQTADEAITKGDADIIAFGRPFISNPDLVERFKRGAELNADPDRGILYSPSGENIGAKGYTDFPVLPQ
jgi:N-ethylmaleimide reductase